MRYYGNVTRYYEKLLFFCCELNRLFTVLYFSVRSSRSSSLRYGLPSSMSVKTTLIRGRGWFGRKPPLPTAVIPDARLRGTFENQVGWHWRYDGKTRYISTISRKNRGVWKVYESKGFIIKFENTGKETSVNCMCKTDTFAGTDIKSPFKRDARLRDSKIKGVPKAGTNSRCPFYWGARPLEVPFLERVNCNRKFG